MPFQKKGKNCHASSREAVRPTDGKCLDLKQGGIGKSSPFFRRRRIVFSLFRPRPPRLSASRWRAGGKGEIQEQIPKILPALWNAKLIPLGLILSEVAKKKDRHRSKKTRCPKRAKKWYFFSQAGIFLPKNSSLTCGAASRNYLKYLLKMF